MEDGERRTCARCGGLNSPIALQCVHCKAALPRDAAGVDWSKYGGSEGTRYTLGQVKRAEGMSSIVIGIVLLIAGGAATAASLVLGLGLIVVVFYGLIAAGLAGILNGVLQMATGKTFEQMPVGAKVLVATLILAGFLGGMYWVLARRLY